jgi:SAM-dependent methyltransferase
MAKYALVRWDRMKQLIKKIIGRKSIDTVKSNRDVLKLRAIKTANGIIGYSKIDLGAGASAISWWTGDYWEGFIFDEKTLLPLKDNSIEFAYSSMFFEHLTDATARTLLREVKRVLSPNSCFRIVVPDFGKYIRKYQEGDKAYFYSEHNDSFKTWAAFGVPIDMEHLLVGFISTIHNLPHDMIAYPSFEDLSASPARVYYPFQTRLPGFYCGPAPEFETEEIREKVNSLSAKDFVQWVFDETDKSKHQDPNFNSWHKNQWDLEKLTAFANAAGFARVEASKYGEAPFSPGTKREKPQHEPLGIYFNFFN